MQQTEKYHFSIIDPSDDFSPDALNENARKLETALLDHKAETDTALSLHKAETDAALSLHKAETDAALSLHKAETDTTLSRHKSETDAALARQAETVVQCREENCLFKLGGPTTLAAPGGDITFSLSGVDMSRYAALLLVHTVNTTAVTSELYLNNKRITTLVKTFGYQFGAVAYTVIINQPVRNCVGVQTFSLHGLDEDANQVTNGTCAEDMNWDAITSVKLTRADFAVLYGLKK